jgi:hypothetical protein
LRLNNGGREKIAVDGWARVVQNSGLLFLAACLSAVLAAPFGARAGSEPGGNAPENEAAGPQLERQVRYLSAALAAVRSENDELRARLEGKLLSGAPAARESGTPSRLMEGGVRVREASRELGMVAMDAGARQGVRVGMVLMIVRDKQSLARARVVDVRRRVSGAVIEELLPGAPYPGPGDRLVVMTDGE